MSEEVFQRIIRDIYRTYHKDVYHLLRCFSNQNDAEDLTQEVFIRILKSYDKYQNRSQLKTWIFSIAKHVALDYYRKKKFLSFFDPFATEIRDEHNYSVEEIIEQKEERVFLENALKKLKPSYRLVIYLKGIKELSFREAAEILGKSENSVKTDYYRALKQLNKLVQHPSVKEDKMINASLK